MANYRGYAKGTCPCGETICRVSGMVKASDQRDAKRRLVDLCSKRRCRLCCARTERVSELTTRQENRSG